MLVYMLSDIKAFELFWLFYANDMEADRIVFDVQNTGCLSLFLFRLSLVDYSSKVEIFSYGADCLFCTWYTNIKKIQYGQFNKVTNLIFIGGGL